MSARYVGCEKNTGWRGVDVLMNYIKRGKTESDGTAKYNDFTNKSDYHLINVMFWPYLLVEVA